MSHHSGSELSASEDPATEDKQVEGASVEPAEEPAEQEVAEEQEEAQQEGDAVLQYSVDLWEGTQAAYSQYGSSKKLLNDISSALSMRAAAEERYAKELMSIHSRESKVGEEDKSSTATAWLVIKGANKELSEVHQAISNTLHQMIKQLQGQLKAEMAEKKRILAEDKELHAQLTKLKNSTEAAKKKYLSVAEAEELQTRKLEGATQAGMQAKKLKQMEKELHKISADREKSHQSYKTLLASLHEMQQSFESSMKSLLGSMQKLEEKRLESIQDYMVSFADCDQTVLDIRAAQLQAIGKSLKEIDTPADIQSFISANKTGKEPEALIEEVHYVEHLGAVEVEVKKRKGTNLRSKKRGETTSAAPASKSKDVSAISIPKNDAAPRGASKSHGAAPENSEPKSPKKKGFGGLLSPRSRAKKEAKSASGSRRTARALFDFDATEDNELGFKAGDVLVILRVDDAGWWDAEMNGEQGMIPGNRVEILEEAIGSDPVIDSEAEADPVPPIEEGVVEKTTVASVPTVEKAAASADAGDSPSAAGVAVDSGESNSEEPVAPEEEPAAEVVADTPAAAQEDGTEEEEEEEADPIGTCTALYNFPGEGEDELPLKVGETVTVYQQVEEWYTGTNTKGDYGLLPMNFCSPLVPISDAEEI